MIVGDNPDFVRWARNWRLWIAWQSAAFDERFAGFDVEFAGGENWDFVGRDDAFGAPQRWQTEVEQLVA
jgi:hypothetical protein